LRDYFVEQNIKHYITRTHANVAERFIRTYKALLHKRIDSVKNTALKDPLWAAYNFQGLWVRVLNSTHPITQLLLGTDLGG
jgi:hypothetical protein